MTDKTEFKVGLLQWPKIILDGLGAHQLFIQLGHDPKDIFFSLGKAQGGLIPLYVKLKFDGKEVAIAVGEYEGTAQEAVDAWQSACAAYNGAGDEKRLEILNRSPARANAVSIIQTMTTFGIPIKELPPLPA